MRLAPHCLSPECQTIPECDCDCGDCRCAEAPAFVGALEVCPVQITGPGGECETVAPGEPHDFWGVYRRDSNDLAHWVTDFKTESDARAYVAAQATR